MKTLSIIWQRLVSSGETCPRCAGTGDEVERAYQQLRVQLRPLGIEPILEIRQIDEAAFKANSSESNRIWIAGKPMEEWLNASAGSSRCCSVCGDSECRTVEVGGATYEVVPEELLVKAGLIAALTINAQQDGWSEVAHVNQRPLRIGIPARVQHPLGDGHGLRGHAYHFLEQTLAHWVMSHGAMLFMIPSLCEECLSTGQALDNYNYADSLDGLILQGGPDIAPELYGQAAKRSDWAGDIAHDTHQIRLFEQFLEARKPILGVCRGAQLINVALGGTLYQDIPSELLSPEMHAQTTQERVVHEIVWDADSSLARLFPGQHSGLVVSLHHQAIKDLGKGLSVEARSSKDKVIEAIRLKGNAYVVGLQWHPECHSGDPSLLDCTAILGEFLIEARLRN